MSLLYMALDCHHSQLIFFLLLFSKYDTLAITAHFFGEIQNKSENYFF